MTPVRSPGTRTLLLYAQDRQGLGHITRSLTIARHLLARYPSAVVYLVTKSALAGHFTLPTHPETVGLVCDLMRESAGLVPVPLPTPVAEWTYEHAPAARSTPMPGPDDDPAWHFLLDLPGPKTPPLLPLDAPITSPEPGKSSAPRWPRKP